MGGLGDWPPISTLVMTARESPGKSDLKHGSERGRVVDCGGISEGKREGGRKELNGVFFLHLTTV